MAAAAGAAAPAQGPLPEPTEKYPLHHALAQGQTAEAVVSLIFVEPGSPSEVDNNGFLPLHYACARKVCTLPFAQPALSYTPAPGDEEIDSASSGNKSAAVTGPRTGLAGRRCSGAGPPVCVSFGRSSEDQGRKTSSSLGLRVWSLRNDRTSADNRSSSGGAFPSFGVSGEALSSSTVLLRSSRRQVSAQPLSVSPQLVQASSPDRLGRLPLHCAVSGSAPESVVRHLLKLHAAAASIDDGSGRLPLHHAAGRSPPQSLALLSTLIEAHPEVNPPAL